MLRHLARTARWLAVAIGVGAGGLVTAEPSSDRPAPKYPPHEAKASATRPPATRAPAEMSATPKATRRTSRATARPETPPAVPPDAEVEGRGLDAGAAMADGLALTEGRLTAYRAGVWEGQRRALSDPLPERFAYEDGLRQGRWDPEGRAFGAATGAAAAADAARVEAPRQVERQFLDLERMPVPAPFLAPPDDGLEFEPSQPPAIEPLFTAFPPGRIPGLPRRFADGFAGWTWTPATLHGCETWRAFSSLDWQDPERAFRIWSDDPRRSGYWRRLPTRRAQALFEAAFADGFLDRLAGTAASVLDPAYGDGFDDGWSYGAFLHAEWSFRRGYAEGFDDAIALAAQVAFEREYPVAYAAAYDAAFSDWMGSAHPAILGVTVQDANDDGVFEPGESIDVLADLANHGGTAGTFALELEGRALTAPARVSLELPARRRVPRGGPLTATLDAALATPSAATLVLRLGLERRDVALDVAFPMGFTGVVAYDHRPLEGQARVVFEVVNRSRRPVPNVEVVRAALDDLSPEDRRELGTVGPGITGDAGFALEGIRPLDLLAGRLAVPAFIIADGKVQDRHTARFPVLATRLDDPSLVQYLVRLGHDPDPDLRDVRAARRLMMQRLEADWRMRCAERGNAYQADATAASAVTALGELVRAYERDRPVLSRAVAFHGLDQEIAALADDLPGVHPNLRRWMKRLAAQIDG